MATETEQKRNKPFTLKISFDEKPDFQGDVAAFLFDSAGNLLEKSKVKDGKVSFTHNEQQVAHNRLFIAPVANQSDEEKESSSIKMMERLNAYEPVLKQRGEILDIVRVPGSILELWPICFCLVRGHVVKDDNGLPVCGAKVHICEVDRFWRWIIKLPDFEVFRFRDDLLKIFDEPPLRRPPHPEPDPSPVSAMKSGLLHLAYLNPQPEPPRPIKALSAFAVRKGETVGLNPQPLPPKETVAVLPNAVRAALSSTSALTVRESLIANVELIFPYFCLLQSWWWRYRCDEITVVETDELGRFQTIVFYSCKGDKPDLYFWVEYEIDGIFQTVYRPSLACHTYWNYACGTDVVIRIKDDRVPACNHGPDLPGCVVQILSIGRQVSMDEIQIPGPGVPPVPPVEAEGLTTADEPFGGKLEPRVWFSRTTLRDVKHVKFYRWSYRRLTEGDGTLLATPGPWTPLTRLVIRHYAILVPGPSPLVPLSVKHVPYTLGPQRVGAEGNLFEIRPAPVPPGGIEWSVVDEREDLASAHFETDKLGSGDNACQKAFDSAGKYELKLELFKDTGVLVDWTAEGIDLLITDVPAPFGTDTVTAVTASNYYRITNGAGHTVAFRMVLRIDNNCCRAAVAPISGVGLDNTPCGFIEYAPGASATLSFDAYHPNGFATFNFSVVRGVSTNVVEASATGNVGSASAPYTLTMGTGYTYQATFAVTDLLKAMPDSSGVMVGPCSRAAFSEEIHVWTKATDGYGRLWYLDAFSHDGFALTPSP